MNKYNFIPLKFGRYRTLRIPTSKIAVSYKGFLTFI